MQAAPAVQAKPASLAVKIAEYGAQAAVVAMVVGAKYVLPLRSNERVICPEPLAFLAQN